MEFPVYRPQSGAMEMWDIMIHSESEKHGKKYKYIPVLVIVEILRTTICFWEWCVAVFWCMPKNSEELQHLYQKTYQLKEMLTYAIPCRLMCCF